jgi:Flp pilus assembly protein TadG
MSRPRHDEGATTVEFALVLPMFILLVGIGMYFSWIYYTQTQVDRAANNAARYAAVPTTDGSYAFCESKIVDKVNSDLFTGSVAMPVASPPSAVQDPSTYDVKVSDGSGTIRADAACVKPNGYVKVQIQKDFTNPFSVILAPFTGTTSSLMVTGTGRARVEAP